MAMTQEEIQSMVLDGIKGWADDAMQALASGDGVAFTAAFTGFTNSVSKSVSLAICNAVIEGVDRPTP
jgi:hypothetical protein